VEAILALALPLVEAVDAVVLCDYAKGVVTERVCQSVLNRCAELGKPSVVDPKGSDYSKYSGAGVITPNLKEAQLAATRLHVPDDPDAWGNALAASLQPSAVLVTKGPAGMTLYRTGVEPVDIPAHARTIYDVTGAGDTVAATTAVSMAAGAPIETAVWMANVAAGIVVRKAGTSTATADELLTALDEVPPRYNVRS